MPHKRLKELRLTNGFSQELVADALFMAQNTYSRIETGKTKMGLELLYRFADFYSVQPHELLDEGSLNIHLDDADQNALADLRQDLPQNNLTIINTLQEQLAAKDRQIEKLLDIITKWEGNIAPK